MNFYSDVEGSLDLKRTSVFIWLTVFNPWTYTQIHTPTVVHGGWEGLDGTPPRSFDMLHDFETILPSSENLWSSWQDEVYFMGGGAAGGLLSSPSTVTILDFTKEYKSGLNLEK